LSASARAMRYVARQRAAADARAQRSVKHARYAHATLIARAADAGARRCFAARCQRHAASAMFTPRFRRGASAFISAAYG